jgi:hypothetical protein
MLGPWWLCECVIVEGFDHLNPGTHCPAAWSDSPEGAVVGVDAVQTAGASIEVAGTAGVTAREWDLQ